MLLHLLLPLRVFGFVTRTHTAVAAAFCGCKQCCAVVGFVVFPKFCLLTLPLFRQHCSSAHFRVALIFFWVFLLLFVSFHTHFATRLCVAAQQQKYLRAIYVLQLKKQARKKITIFSFFNFAHITVRLFFCCKLYATPTKSINHLLVELACLANTHTHTPATKPFSNFYLRFTLTLPTAALCRPFCGIKRNVPLP